MSQTQTRAAGAGAGAGRRETPDGGRVRARLGPVLSAMAHGETEQGAPSAAAVLPAIHGLEDEERVRARRASLGPAGLAPDLALFWPSPAPVPAPAAHPFRCPVATTERHRECKTMPDSIVSMLVKMAKNLQANA